MNREKIRGCGDVFRFTFVQSVKSKAYKITCAILFVIAFMAFPVISFMSDKTGDDDNDYSLSDIETLSVVSADEDFVEALSGAVSLDERFKNIRVVMSGKDAVTMEKELEESKDDNLKEIMLIADVNNDIYQIVYGKNTGVAEADVNILASYISDNMINILGRYYKAAEGTEQYLNPDIELEYVTFGVGEDVDVSDEDDDIPGDGEDDEFTQAQYWVTYVFLFVVMLFVAFSGEAVATSIITEKSTRVVEYILVSIKPMALIIGKVLAMLCTIGIQIVSICTSLTLSWLVCNIVDGSGGMTGAVADAIKNSGIISHITPLGVVAAVLLILSGIIFYGLIAGIAGATVSRIEEASEGLKIFTIILMIGMYVAMALMMTMSGGGDWGIFTNVAYLLPISASFIVPAFVLMGKVGIVTAFMAIVILLLCIVLLLMYVSKVYEYLIYHRGEPIKLKQLIHMSGKRNGG